LSEATSSKDPERRFRDALGYAFREPRLLVEALTHSSFAHEVASPVGSRAVADNERLEFLGDAVLDLVVATELMRRFPNAREGELHRMRVAIVHEAALARLARQIHLGPALRLGRGEERSGGRDRDALLADAFEAVVAAIYLDGGFAAAQAALEPLLDFGAGEEGLAVADPKTELQQMVQAARKLTPCYREALPGDDHPGSEPPFVMEVVLGERVLGSGEGPSKKLAQQRAAEAVLARIRAEGLDAVLAS
jgi:ribonuclease-3